MVSAFRLQVMTIMFSIAMLCSTAVAVYSAIEHNPELLFWAVFASGIVAAVWVFQCALACCLGLRIVPVLLEVEPAAALSGATPVAAAGDIPAYEQPPSASASASAPETECAACIGAVEAGEMVKRLPACQHVYHQECIDQWLRARSTCPICRCDAFALFPAQMV